MKKGQSAMEFLSTYGWMVLVIVLIVAALFAIGAFNPQKPEMCDFGNDLYCGNIKLTYSAATDRGSLSLTLKNGFSYPITVCGLSCRDKQDYATTNYLVSDCPVTLSGGVHSIVAAVTIPPGGEGRIVNNRVGTGEAGSGAPCRYDLNADAVTEVGATYAGHISIFYYRPGDPTTSAQRVVRGRIVATVQPE